MHKVQENSGDSMNVDVPPKGLRSNKRRKTGERAFRVLEKNTTELDNTMETTNVGKKRGRMAFEKTRKSAKAEMNKFADFDIIEKLGEGAYGVVTKAMFKPTGDIYAIKKVKLDSSNDGIPATTIREVALLKRCTHPHVVELYSILYHMESLHLVFEFVDRDLHDYLQKVKGALPISTVKDWMIDMYLGLEFCHSQGILHRDMKPQNILVSKTGILKIADFGLGRECHMPILTLTHEVVTLWYRCPEVLLGTKKYGHAVDTWSMGCILSELLSQQPPTSTEAQYGRFTPLFPGDSEIGQILKIFQFTGTPTEELWPGCTQLKFLQSAYPRWPPASDDKWLTKAPRADELALDMIKKTLLLDPNERLCVKECIRHPFLRDTWLARRAKTDNPRIEACRC